MKMNRLAFAVTLLSASLATVPLLGAAAPADGDAYEATITKVVRQVEWQRYRTTRWQKAALETLLLVGDTLRTGSEAHAELRYGDGSITRVGSLTSLTLTGDGRREMHLDSGRVWLKIRKHSAGMRVITPGAVAAVTGTELMVDYDPLRKVTEVTVFEGAVNVTGDVGDLVKVLGGTTTRVPFKAPALTPVPLDERKLEERSTIFKPLSVDSKQPDQPDNGGKQPESNDGKQSTSNGSDNPDAKQPDTPEAQQPEVPTSEPSAAPIAKDPIEPETAPSAAPVEPKPKVLAPDLKGQVKDLNDPRLINGSPTTGSVRVIIE